MKKAFAVITCLVLALLSFTSFSETQTDDITLLFEKEVHLALYNSLYSTGLDKATTEINKIELYTLPPNSTYSCRYLYDGEYLYEEGITDDNFFIAIYYSTKNQFGIETSDMVANYCYSYQGLKKDMESPNFKPDTIGTIMRFPGGISGRTTSLLYGTIESGLPWTITELDVAYLVHSYNQSAYSNR